MDTENLITPADAAPAARAVAPERGWGWWTEAWALFARSALLWVAIGLILFVGSLVVGMVPLLGTVALTLLVPAFGGSWMLAARKVEQGGALEVADLFSAFRGERFASLLVLGALLLAATLVIGVVAGVFGFGVVSGLGIGGMRHQGGGMAAMMGGGLLALLVFLLLGIVVGALLWFAPALVVFRGARPVDALRASGQAVLKNLLPFVVYSAIQLVLGIAASIPFGLGWIVLLPVMLLTVYVSYREVFGG